MMSDHAFLAAYLERQKSEKKSVSGPGYELLERLAAAPVDVDAPQQSTSPELASSTHDDAEFQSRKALGDKFLAELRRRPASPKCVTATRDEVEFQARKAHAEGHFTAVILQPQQPAVADSNVTAEPVADTTKPATCVVPNVEHRQQILPPPRPTWPGIHLNPEASVPTSRLTPTAPDAAMRTVQEFVAERAATRIQKRPENPTKTLFTQLGALIDSRAPSEAWDQQLSASMTPSPAIHRTQFTRPPAPSVTCRPVESLTACLDSADCPATARKIFRVLFSLGLESVRARGIPVRPEVAVFHLPIELLAAHIECSRVTIWRNLKPLLASGVLAAVDHYGTLRRASAVTGKLWAISLCPERVLSGHAAPVKVTMGDLRYPWRDLDKDARQGRTAYALTRSEAQQAAEKAQREAKWEERAAAKVRAHERRSARAQARADG